MQHRSQARGSPKASDAHRDIHEQTRIRQHPPQAAPPPEAEYILPHVAMEILGAWRAKDDAGGGGLAMLPLNSKGMSREETFGFVVKGRVGATGAISAPRIHIRQPYTRDRVDLEDVRADEHREKLSHRRVGAACVQAAFAPLDHELLLGRDALSLLVVLLQQGRDVARLGVSRGDAGLCDGFAGAFGCCVEGACAGEP